MSDFDVAGFLAEERARVEEALRRALGRLNDRIRPDLLPVIEHGVLTGGKRIRPILCVAAHRASGGPLGPAAYDLGASVELVHAYSLMHDDLPCMDDAELRRGRPTSHRAFGEERTMEAGAALIPGAALVAWTACGELGCQPRTSREVLRVLTRAAGAGGMVGGQALDLLAEGGALGASDLDELHGRKTGALLAAPLRMGALAAGAPSPIQEGLERYGRAIGLAFQIADDILDATASTGALGKNPSDQALGKSTYVAIHGLEEARRRAREQAGRARVALGEAGLDSPALTALADYVVERKR